MLTPRRLELLSLVDHCQASWARIVSETISSCQHILTHNSPSLFGFFQYGAVSRPIKRIESLQRRLQSFKIILCQLIVDGVIIYAMEKIGGKGKLCYPFGQIGS